MAVGCLSSRKQPDFPGLERSRPLVPHRTLAARRRRLQRPARRLHRHRLVGDPVDPAHRPAGGASVRVPAHAELQRARPHNAPLRSETQRRSRRTYAERREQARESRRGVCRSIDAERRVARSRSTPRSAERDLRGCWRQRRLRLVLGAFTDLLTSGGERHRRRIRARQDPRDRRRPGGRRSALPDRLSARHQAAVRRHRLLRDVQPRQRDARRRAARRRSRRSPRRACARRSAEYELDSIVFATGFDAMTGRAARASTSAGAAASTLEEQVGGRARARISAWPWPGFPNLFMITGPGQPVGAQQHGGRRSSSTSSGSPTASPTWASTASTASRPTPRPRTRGSQHVNEVANKTLYPLANSWYMGANIPGKPRVFMPYIGGVGSYRREVPTRSRPTAMPDSRSADRATARRIR